MFEEDMGKIEKAEGRSVGSWGNLLGGWNPDGQFVPREGVGADWSNYFGSWFSSDKARVIRGTVDGPSGTSTQPDPRIEKPDLNRHPKHPSVDNSTLLRREENTHARHQRNINAPPLRVPEQTAGEATSPPTATPPPTTTSSPTTTSPATSSPTTPSPTTSSPTTSSPTTSSPTTSSPTTSSPTTSSPTTSSPTTSSPTTSAPTKKAKSGSDAAAPQGTDWRDRLQRAWNDDEYKDALTMEKERLASLRPFFPVAGTDAFDDQQDEEADRLKHQNLLMGQCKPANWPLGNMDNKLWVGNQANEGLRYMPTMFEMPVKYSGGTLTDGATLYGSYPKAQTGRYKTKVSTNKRLKIR